MKRAPLRASTIILGILAAMAVICSHFFHYQSDCISKKEAKKEQRDKQDDRTETIISIPSTSLPSSHVELNRDVFFLFETLLNEDESSEVAQRVDIPLTKFFDVLLGSFISPNAP
jgi:hypothetical protein